MVLHVGRLKDNDLDYVREDIRAVVLAAAKYGAIVKVILETCLLTGEEIVTACRLSKEAGAAFVKTSTGFNAGGATAADVYLMKNLSAIPCRSKPPAVSELYPTPLL